MKKLLLLTFLSIAAIAALAQCTPPQKINQNYQYRAFGADTAQRIPNTRAFQSCWLTPGSIMYDSTANRYYKWIRSLGWVPLVDADNGVTDSSDIIQLGQDNAAGGHAAEFLTDRLIEQNGHFLLLVDSVVSANDNWLSIMDTTFGANNPIPIHIHLGELNGGFGGGYFTVMEPFNFRGLYTTGRVPGGVQIAGRVTNSYAQEFNGLGNEGAPDNVYNFFSYNENFNNAQSDPRDGAFRFAAESNFINSVEGTQWGFEFHIPEVTNYAGHTTRLESIYTNKENNAAHAVDYLVDREGHTDWTGTDITYYDIGAAGGTGLSGMDFVSFGNVVGGGEDGLIEFKDIALGTNTQLECRAGTLSIQGQGQPDFSFFGNPGYVFLAVSHSATPSVSPVVVGSDPGAPGASSNAALQCISTSRGFMPPKMTTTQKLAIVVTSADEGLEVYDLTLHQMSYYNGTSWVNF